MQISTRCALAVSLCALLTAGAAAFNSQDLSGVEIHSDEVAGKVHVLYGAGGNIAVSIGPDGVLAIDSQFAPLAPKLLKAVEELGGRSPSWLINTHWHGDHAGGNADFGAAASIVAHLNVRRRLNGDGEIGGKTNDSPQDGAGLPLVTYKGENGPSLHFNGEEVAIMHFGAGHTDGDSVIWFKGSDVLHMGDLFFSSGYPFIDLDSGGDVRGYLRALRRIYELAGHSTMIIPGHGEVSNKKGLESYILMLEETVTRVQDALNAGRTVDEMIEMDLLGDFDGHWGRGYVNGARHMQTLARGLSK